MSDAKERAKLEKAFEEFKKKAKAQGRGSYTYQGTPGEFFGGLKLDKRKPNAGKKPTK
jgi:hypothetical protein